MTTAKSIGGPKRVSTGVICAGLLATAASQAQAAGFLIYDLSAEALGKASAVTASTREPAAVWFNPAALAYMGHGVSLGATGVMATARFEPKGGGPEVQTEPGRFVLPTLFANTRVHDRVALGFGVYPAFGLSITWPEDWLGREHAIKASIQTVSFNPTVAVKLLPDLSFAVGASAVRGAVEFLNGLPAAVGGGTAQIGGGTWGFGGNAALLYQAVPDVVHLALTWRSRVRLDFDGRVDFDPHPDFARSLPDEGGTAVITLPDVFSAGVMWRPTPSWTLTFDPNLVLWSTFDQLVIDFATAPDEVMERNNKPAFTLRFGTEWTSPEGLSLRGGLIFDQNPSPAETMAPSLPDANRVDLALGIGYAAGAWKVDAGYLLVYFLPSEAIGGKEGPEGTYHSLAHLLGLTVSAQFGP